MHDQQIRVAVDAVVFGYKQGILHVLCILQKFGPFKGYWSLPGGFVLNDEPLKDAVARELKEEAGIQVSYLEQLYTFGDDPSRDPRGRVISVSYFALVDADHFTLMPDSDAADARWFDVQNLPTLAYDHKHITDVALQRLQAKVHYQPIGFNLLDTLFPFSDLEHLYTAILRKEIDRRNFRKKMLSFGILEETDQVKATGSGRPAKLFRFNEPKYQELMKEGFSFEIKFA